MIPKNNFWGIYSIILFLLPFVVKDAACIPSSSLVRRFEDSAGPALTAKTPALGRGFLVKQATSPAAKTSTQ